MLSTQGAIRFPAALACLLALCGCARPRAPMLPSATPRQVVAPFCELIVINDDGPIDADGRTLSQRGTVAFLNEANDGPAHIAILGDFSARQSGDHGFGDACLTVRGIRFSADGATTVGGIPAGGVASTCIGAPGVYRYEAHVADRVYKGAFTVEAADVFVSSAASQGRASP